MEEASRTSGGPEDEAQTTGVVAEVAAGAGRKRKHDDETDTAAAADAAGTKQAEAKADDDAEEAPVKKVKSEVKREVQVAEEEEEDDARPSFASASSSSTGAAAAAPPSSSSSLLGGGIGARLLALAGYKGSGGLGKRGTGIVEPVKSSSQFATEGLGFQGAVKRQEHAFEAFEVEVALKPIWMVHDARIAPIPTLDDTRDWITEGPHDPSIISDERFCAMDVQDALLAAKSAFDDVPSLQFRLARERSNPFERIRGEFFQNRAALKMAEMDAMCSRIFTQPPSTRILSMTAASPGNPSRKKRELVHVGDVCAGPGGFSEFMLTVLKWVRSQNEGRIHSRPRDRHSPAQPNAER